MIIEIPTLIDGTPHYTIRTQLEGTDYQFTFRFGERRGAWVFDLATLDGVEILTGQTVTCGRNFLKRCAMSEKPPGLLWALNVVEPKDDPLALPGLYDLGPGGRCRMYYTESTTAEENAAAGLTAPIDV